MAEQHNRMQAPWPAPPPFYQHFTPANLKELRKRRKAAGIPAKPAPTSQDSEPARDVDVLSLPVELRYLVPPPPPADGKFKSFGFDRALDAAEPSLSDADVLIPRLYPGVRSVRLNPQAHLISLARGQLRTFLLLIGNLTNNAAEGYEQPTQDLEALTFNMHELINQYRPHQARETLILGMEERVRRMKDEIKAIEEGKGKVREVMERLQAAGGAGGGGEGEAMQVDMKAESAEDGKRKGRQRAAWAALEGLA